MKIQKCIYLEHTLWEQAKEKANKEGYNSTSELIGVAIKKSLKV